MERYETIQLTPKQALREAWDQLSDEYEELYLQYYEKICKKCIGTQKQKDRDCGVFVGCHEPCCDTMDSWINRKQKKKSEKIMAEAIFNLQKQGISTNV